MIDLATQWGEDWDIKILIHEGKERGLQDENIFQSIKSDIYSLGIVSQRKPIGKR